MNTEYEHLFNRQFIQEDKFLIAYQYIMKEMVELYYAAGRESEDFVNTIQWSRDWEYPFAVIASRVKKGMKVLDAGCGCSPLLLFLAKYGCDCYGVDTGIIPPEVVSLFVTPEKAYKSLWGFNPDFGKNIGLNIDYRRESLAKTSFPDKFFDRIFCISVIEHLDRETVLQGFEEFARVLQDKGIVAITIDSDAKRFLKIIKKTKFSLIGKSDYKKPEAGFKTQKPGHIAYVSSYLLRKKHRWGP